MKNLIKIFSRAETDTVDKGLLWYTEAHNFCVQVANKYNLDLVVVCGILSALSPGVNWEQNKKETINLILANTGSKNKFSFTTYGKNVLKAQDIFRGIRNPHTAFSVKTGAKTYNFFLNLLDPTNTVPVTIDRHAYRIATGDEYTRPTTKQYGIIADSYRRAADRIKLIPCQLQAILWLDYRNKHVANYTEFVPF